MFRFTHAVELHLGRRFRRFLGERVAGRLREAGEGVLSRLERRRRKDASHAWLAGRRSAIDALPFVRRRSLAAAGVLFAAAGCEAGGDPAAPTGPGVRAVAVSVVSGGGYPALTGRALPDPLVIRVAGAAGEPAAGVEITFAPVSGSGHADPASVVSGDDGEATTTWVLGPDPGIQTLLVAGGNAATAVNRYVSDLEAELDLVFRPPTAAEVQAVRASWAGRDTAPADVTVELTEPYRLGRSPAVLQVVSHEVAGVRHYGAIVTPDSAAQGSLPVLVYLHGGEDGVDLSEVRFVSAALGELRDSFVYVIPSFRAEPLRHEDRQWVSEGPASLWDYDVDDALALVNVALTLVPSADSEGLSVVGGSRGGGVALLMGIRDPRIRSIIAFFGPTDFFDEWVRDIARDLARGIPHTITGVAHLDSTVVQPYFRGDLSLADVRIELARRSPVLFARDLPLLQLHHGEIDGTVSVSQAHSMIRAMEALGRGPPEFEAFIYEGAGHEVLELQGAVPRAVDFLRRALASSGGSR